MELYFTVSIVERVKEKKLLELYTALELPLVLSMHGRGTATAEQLNLCGFEATEKVLMAVVADAGKTRQLIKSAKQRLYIDFPGNGIMLAVPVKSVGGGPTLAYLTNNTKPDSSVPAPVFDHELVVIILNEGHTDAVMDAARSAQAAGGTILHAKGTGAKNAQKFFGVSLADEKEVILIVAGAADKAAIMQAVIGSCGPGTAPGAISFSLPISAVAGLRAAEGD